MKEIVTFFLSGKKYGVEVSRMQGVENYIEPAKTPEMPECLAGVVSIRDEWIPVVDLRKRLVLPVTEITFDTKLFVLRTTHGKLAFVADGISKIVRAEDNEIQSFPALVKTDATSYVEFIVRSEGVLVLVINSDGILSEDEWKAVQKVVDDMKTGGSND